MHEDYLELISRAIDNDLTESERVELQAHLAVCEECREYYEFLSRADHTLQENLAEPPEGLHGAIMNAVHSEQKNASPKQFFKKYRFTAVAAAAALIIMAAAYVGPFGENADTTAETATSQSLQGGETASLMRAMPAPVAESALPETAFAMPEESGLSEDRKTALEDAGHMGYVAVVSGINAEDMDYPAITLSNGESIFILTESEFSTLMETEGITLAAQFAPVSEEYDSEYWVFID